MSNQPPGDDDARRHDRVEVNREFKSIDAFLSEYVSDISHGGVFIRSKAPLPVGTQVELRFTIILEDVETIEGTGIVVRAGSGDAPGMGVQFVDLTERSKDVIDRLLAYREANTSVSLLPDGSVADGEAPINLEPVE